MVSIYEKLDSFLMNQDAHAFLLYGPWGVGETFCVNKWLAKVKQDKEYKVISLSLFGISSLNELNALALTSESIKNKVFKTIKGLNHNLSFGVSPVTISLPLVGIVSSFLKEKHNLKQKYIFVIDDIERKDNKLTIEEILGFVDSLPKKNTKVILVTNLNKLNETEEFKGFKEKTIQDEYCLNFPSKEAVKEIIGLKYADKLITNKYPIKNLRTLFKLKKILNETNKNIDNNLLNCIYYCCVNIFENQLGKEDFVLEYSEQLRYSNKIFSNNKSQEEIEINIKNEVESRLKVLSRPFDILVENIKIRNLLSDIKEDKINEFVKNVYSLIINENYRELFELEIVKRSLPLKVYNENGDSVFFSGTPDNEYERIMSNFISYFNSNQYDHLDLFKKFCLTVNNCQDLICENSKGKEYEAQLKRNLPLIMAQYFVDNTNLDYVELNPPSLRINTPSWILNIEKNILEKFYDLFNKTILKQSKTTLINLEEIDEKFSIIQIIFTGIDQFDYTQIQFDDFVKNTIENVSKYLDGTITENQWSQCLSIFKWLYTNQEKYSLPKTKELINELKNEKGVRGYRFSFLSQYGHVV